MALQDHGQRLELNDEVHARPHPMLAPPVRASHLALLTGEGGEQAERAKLAELCARFGAAGPSVGANFFTADLGAFALRWERHTEFSTYTFLNRDPFDDPFADPIVDLVPRDWLAEVTGERLVAVHIAIEPRDTPPRDAASVAALFSGENLIGGRAAGGAAAVWTDFRISEDGFSRILVRDEALEERQVGRLMQRLLEIETYRMMALLALPLARRTGARLSRIDRRLAELTADLAVIEGLEGERALLGELTRLAAEAEQLSAASAYRFSAARAYYALVERRIAELREERFEGRQTIGGFMARRLDPAMRTCRSVAERQELLSQRVARTGELLRTRVDVALEGQNRDLLETMARRARLQIRLQQTVEGLSVVAITYYLVGLVGYAAEALSVAGVALNVYLVQGISIPVIALAVWLGVRRLRRTLLRDAADGDA